MAVASYALSNDANVASQIAQASYFTTEAGLFGTYSITCYAADGKQTYKGWVTEKTYQSIMADSKKGKDKTTDNTTNTTDNTTDNAQNSTSNNNSNNNNSPTPGQSDTSGTN